MSRPGHIDAPKTVFGLIVRGAYAPPRRGRAPFTVMSCEISWKWPRDENAALASPISSIPGSQRGLCKRRLPIPWSTALRRDKIGNVRFCTWICLDDIGRCFGEAFGSGFSRKVPAAGRLEKSG